MLHTIDGRARTGPADDVPPLVVGPGPRHTTGFRTVVWATGFQPSYPWLRLPVLDPSGGLRYDRGVTDAPGLYAIGLRFQYRRNATFAWRESMHASGHGKIDNAGRRRVAAGQRSLISLRW